MKENIALALGLMLATFHASADIYKCEVDGVPTFRDSPCEDTGANYGKPSRSTLPAKPESAEVKKALLWQRLGVKTCTYFQSPEDAKANLESAVKMADAVESKVGGATDPEWRQVIESARSGQLVDECEPDASAKCHDYVVIVNGVLEELYYTENSALLKQLENDCSGGGGAQFTLLE